MIKLHTVCLTLLSFFSSVAVCSTPGVEHTTTEQVILKNIAVGNYEVNDFVIDFDSDAEYYTATFEPFKACNDFKLTKSDVREFLKDARVVTRGTLKSIPMYEGESRCHIDGQIRLKNGQVVRWMIDRARNGWLTYSSDDDSEPILLFCDKCKNKKFYSKDTKRLSDYRPIVQSVDIEKNGAYSGDSSAPETPEDCKTFVLTETDVLEFFKIARLVTRREYSHDYDMLNCSVSGKALLKNGERVRWSIDRFNRGILSFDDYSVYFSRRSCDIECMNGP